MTTHIRWIPIREMAAMQSATDRRFEQERRYAHPLFNGDSLAPGFNRHSLALDVYETDADYTIVAVLPGLNADDINISLHDGGLTISAEIATPEVNDHTRVLLQERTF